MVSLLFLLVLSVVLVVGSCEDGDGAGDDEVGENGEAGEDGVRSGMVV